MEQNNSDEIIVLCDLLMKKLPTFISSGHIEVQERASSSFILIQMLRAQFPSNEQNTMDSDNMLVMTEKPENHTEEIEQNAFIPVEAIEIVQEMALLFAGDLNPVAPKAQKKVPIPDELNLDEWINQQPVDSSDSSDEEQTDLFIANDHVEEVRTTKNDITPEEVEKVIIVQRLITFP